MFDFIIVGSGLSGTSVAHELISSGKTVLMIDIGDDSSFNANQLKKTVGNMKAAEIPRTIISQVSGIVDGLEGSKKNWFGDFITEWWRRYWRYEHQDCMTIGPSTSVGGYSRVWGGSCMPRNLLKNMMNLIYNEDSSIYVDKALNFLSPISASAFIKGSKSNCQILLSESKVNLNDQKWVCDEAKISSYKIFDECNGCGSCLLGCHADLIFCSKNILEILRFNDKFEYISGHLCINFQEEDEFINIYCKDLVDKNNCLLKKFSAKRLILAAGPLATSEIVAKSINISSPIEFMTSQHFSFPICLKKPEQLIRKLPIKTVGFNEMVIYDLNDDRPSFFLQLYSSNNVLRYYVGGKFFSIGMGKVIGNLVDKLFVACQGYLDSNNSPKLVVEYSSNGVNYMKRVTSDLRYEDHLLEIRNIFTKLSCWIGKPKIHLAGDGFHFGGSFPIDNKFKGEKFYSDQLGRPMEMKRVHIVDASVLPFIPAGPFTSLSLANAFRITEKLLKEFANE